MNPWTLARLLVEAASTVDLTMRIGPWLLQVDSDGLMFVRATAICRDHDDEPSDPAGHVPSNDCPCGVLEVPVKRDGGEVVWISVHRVDVDLPANEQAERAVEVFEAMDEMRRGDG